MYNCVRVLNNGIDILLFNYDQKHFLCINRLALWFISVVCTAEGQSPRCLHDFCQGLFVEKPKVLSESRELK